MDGFGGVSTGGRGGVSTGGRGASTPKPPPSYTPPPAARTAPVAAPAPAPAATPSTPPPATDPDAWRTAADEGWSLASRAAEPAAAGTTRSGLPKRVPQAQLVPGGIEPKGGRDRSRRTPMKYAACCRPTTAVCSVVGRPART